MQGSCNYILGGWSRVSGEGCIGLLHPGLPSTLQVAPELPGALEVVLRSSHSADMETETKHQEAHWVLWAYGRDHEEGVRFWRYLHLKCQGAIGNPGFICLSGEHLLFPMQRGGTSAVSASQPSPSDTIKGILLSGGKSDPH